MGLIRKKSKNTVTYLIALAVIIVAFLLLGGKEWLTGLGHGQGGFQLASLEWAQILISLVVGFLLGYLFCKRR